jgi:hypothetical protein
MEQSIEHYYQRDLSHLDVSRIDPRAHFCEVCGVEEESGIWVPTIFTCPGYDGRCRCLNIKGKEDGRWIQHDLCSLECASKAKAVGKKVWYSDTKGKWQVW